MRRAWLLGMVILAVLLAVPAWAQGGAIPLPLSAWRGEENTIEGLPGRFKSTIGYPEKQRASLTYASETDIPVGVYRLRLKLRASHVCDEVAWNSGVTINANGQKTSLECLYFAKANAPEWKEVTVVQPDTGVIRLALSAFCDPEAFKHMAFASTNKAGGGEPSDDPDGGGDEIAVGLSAKEYQYLALDAAELVPLSRTGFVRAVTTDKIHYMPGATLKATATVQDVGGKGGKGTLTFYLEHDVNVRDKVKELPVTLAPEPQQIAADIPLPARELGYALVAVYTSPDGKDRTEGAEYFTIAKNFYRTAIHGGAVRFGNSLMPAERQRDLFAKMRENYQNCGEMFAWAEEDMVKLDPDTDWWFSGQTCYHLNKAGLQSLIGEAHKQGIACVTYGKFIMSGYLGWKTAYDYPLDHRGQYHYPVGMWEGVDTLAMDRFQNKEFYPIGFGPNLRDGVFSKPLGWQAFVPINPDPTPRMTRIAADAIIRGVEMFGWDAVRWDGHPRMGWACGGNDGKFDYYDALRTQALVRYFKDITNAKYPDFQHGYNYLFTQGKPQYDWAFEDFELDELCRGGGLIMNESIRNSAGRPFEWIASNIQVEGDLCRERGGLLLGISCDGDAPRDSFLEAILYAAGGMRPMGLASDNRLVNRYNLRYARYTFDENLRRLAKPEGVIKPQAETSLWWQPFVYETPLEGGKEQLVVNLLNIPRKAVPKEELSKKLEWDMPAGSEPVTLALTLPQGYAATGAHFINPFTLAVTSAEMANGRIEVPTVDIWSVLVVDLTVAAGSPTLNSLYGPPVTFKVKRPNLDVERIAAKPLDISKTTVEVNKDMSFLAPKTANPAPVQNLDVMGWDERNDALLKMAAGHDMQELLKGWWHGGSLPADLKLKDKPPTFPDLTPHRDGVLDIFYGRGPVDYRLRLLDIFAGFDRVQIHDAPLEGCLRQWAGHYLSGNISPAEFPHYDLFMYVAIPHNGIGAEQSYALVDYVKAGGGVFFTGGEYAFGKGGYDFTILERELLPVQCTETVDVKYAEGGTPFVFEPGKDFAELNAKLDFAVKPAFWCYNRVALKKDPRVKVFLKSGNKPILVGWQLGKGRVACLLTDYRGKSEDGTTMFFDWPQWPALMRAIMIWLAPDAAKTDPQPVVAKSEVAALLQTLAADTATDVSTGGGAATTSDDPEAAGGELALDDPGVMLDEKTLKKRVPLLRKLVAMEGKEVTAGLAGQLAKIANLPADLREEMFDNIKANPPANLAEIAAPALETRVPAVREQAWRLLAIAGSPVFVKVLKNPPPADLVKMYDRDRALARAVANYAGDDLATMGAGKIAAWNKEEAAVKARYVGTTGGTDFSLAAPEQPCTDSEKIYSRIGWLAYLSRRDPATYGPQFAAEWLKIGQYKEYCNLYIWSTWEDKVMSEQAKRSRVADLQAVQAAFDWLSSATEPALLALMKEHPEIAAKGFAKAHFLHEVDRAINLLGRYPIRDTRILLTGLTNATQPKLASFAKARLAGQ